MEEISSSRYTIKNVVCCGKPFHIRRAHTKESNHKAQVNNIATTPRANRYLFLAYVSPSLPQILRSKLRQANAYVSCQKLLLLLLLLNIL